MLVKGGDGLVDVSQCLMAVLGKTAWWVECLELAYLSLICFFFFWVSNCC